MKHYIWLLFTCSGFLSIPLAGRSQVGVPLTYTQYLEKVCAGNLEYAAEKLNVDISEAEVTAAKVFNDPNLSVSYSNNEDHRLQMGQSVEVELSKTFTFGKRGAGLALARSESELTRALLADYFRNLRADATISYLEAIKQQALYQVKRHAYHQMKTLAQSDSLRFSLGQIREVDAMQTQVEARILCNELLQAGAELENTFSALSLLMGCIASDTLYHPTASLYSAAGLSSDAGVSSDAALPLEAGLSSDATLPSEVGLSFDTSQSSGAELSLEAGLSSDAALPSDVGLPSETFLSTETSLHLARRDFILSDLLATASVNRTDLTAALKNQEVATRALKLARRERNTDVDLSIAVSRNNRVRNEEAPAPPFTGITAGIAVPLKFSNFNKGAVRAARYREQQAALQYQQASLQVQTEVMQAYRNYQSFTQQVQQYDNGLLSKAREVMKGKIYSYSRGEVSLLEVLDAERTYDEVQAQYIETLFNYHVALVELERSAGIWDIRM